MSVPTAAVKSEELKSTSRSEDVLCYNCERLTRNLQYLRQCKLIEYGTLQNLRFRIEGREQECPLCNIIRGTVEKSQAAEPNPVTVAGLDIVARLDHKGPRQVSTSPWSVVLNLELGGLFQMLTQSSAYRRQIPLGVIDSRSRAASSARLIDVDKVDFLLIKDWLVHCQEHHVPDLNSAAFQEPVGRVRPTVYLIDTEDECLVKVTQGAGNEASGMPNYVALSYVWGKVKVPRLSKSLLGDCCKNGGLRQMPLALPATITDAMLVVRKLDFRYLWVDSLCIVQDDEQHLNDSMSMMHLIFGEAEFVIVAADGDNANAGISGLHNRSGVTQKTVKALEHLTLTEVWNPWDSLAQSRWNRRAWTLQERVLARRCVVFVDGKVFMTCKTRELCASEDQEGTKVNVQATVTAASPKTISFDMKSTAPELVISGYTRLANAYSRMEMTDNSDIINAFKGLSTVFQAYSNPDIDGIADNNVESWLMPPGYIDAMMLWQPVKTCERRTGLGKLTPPSWSWVTWGSEVHWPHINTFEDGEESNGSVSLINPCVKWERKLPPAPPRNSLLRGLARLGLESAATLAPARETQNRGQYLVFDSSTAFLTVGNPGVVDHDEPKDEARPYDLVIATDKKAAKDHRCEIPLGCCPFDCEGVQDPGLITKGYYDDKCSDCRFGFNHVPNHRHQGAHTHTAYRCCGYVHFNDAAFFQPSSFSPSPSSPKRFTSSAGVYEFVIISESRDDRVDRKNTGQPTKDKALANTGGGGGGESASFHLYNVMAIAPNNDVYGSYRRVGLGRIQKKAWELFNPKPKTVVLY